MKLGRRFASILLPALATGLLAGCAGHVATIGGSLARTSESPGYVIAAFDRTGSTEREAVRSSQLDEVYRLCDIAHVHHTKMTLWALDHDASVLWDSGVPHGSDDDAFIGMVKSELGLSEGNSERNQGNVHIARPGVLLQHLNAALAQRPAPSGPLCLFLSTDGAAEDPRDAPVFAREAVRLCDRHAGLTVIVSGIRPENRERWQNAFASLGDRYVTAGPRETDTAINAFRTAMYGA